VAESFVWNLIGDLDLNLGYGSTFTATLPDGSTGTFNKINLSTFYNPFTVSFSATPSFDLVNGAIQVLTLTGNVTSSTITQSTGVIVTGTRLVLRLIQDVTGGRTFTWPTNVTGASASMVSTTANQITFVELQYSGTKWEILTPPVNFSSSAVGVSRVRNIGGTPLVAGDFALSAAWGATASVGSISGTDQACQFTVTCAGAGITSNPTTTLTFHDGTWTTTPIAIVMRNGGNAYTFQLTWTVSPTQIVITFNGLPKAAETFTFVVLLFG